MAAEVTVFSLQHTTARDLRWRADRPEHGPVCFLGAIGPSELACLGEVLGLGDADSIRSGFSLLVGESQESPWVVSLPEGLGAAVACVEDDRVADVAAGWSAHAALSRDVLPAAPSAVVARLARFLRSTAGPWVLLIRMSGSGGSGGAPARMRESGR
jgi:hypothetical protein